MQEPSTKLLSLFAGEPLKERLSPGGEAPGRKIFPFVSSGYLHEAIPAAVGDETKASVFLIGLARGLMKAGATLLWVREEGFSAEHGELYAPGLSAFGLDPRDVILVRAKRRIEASWAAEQGLKRSKSVVLMELGAQGRAIDLTVTRRLALAAQASGATALVLRGDLVSRSAEPSAAWTRWQIASAEPRSTFPGEVSPLVLNATLLRNRAGAPGAKYFLEWISDEHQFRAQALGGGLAAQAFNRSA